MKRTAIFVCFVLMVMMAAGTQTGTAQAVESGEARGFHIDAGGMVSAFEPGKGSNILIGGGTYVDFHITHWLQAEAEGRWLRWNQYYGETQDNYLIGPRVPVYRLGRHGQIYGKALIGLGKMTFPFGGYGSFTALAFGGTLDYRLSRRVTLRAIDFEYQYWPVFLPGQSLQPYGASAGVAYRVW